MTATTLMTMDVQVLARLKRAGNALVDQKLLRMYALKLIISDQVSLNAQHLHHYLIELAQNQQLQLPRLILQISMDKQRHARIIMAVFVLEPLIIMDIVHGLESYV